MGETRRFVPQAPRSLRTADERICRAFPRLTRERSPVRTQPRPSSSDTVPLGAGTDMEPGRPPWPPTARARTTPPCARGARAAGRAPACARPPPGPLRRTRAAPVAVGQELERALELHPLGELHELEGVAALATAEAIEALLGRIDAERRRALVAEGAQPLATGRPRAAQLHARTDQVDHVDRGRGWSSAGLPMPGGND